MKLLLLLLVVVAYVAKGEALQCYGCSSETAKACADPFDKKGEGVTVHNCTQNAHCSKLTRSINSVNHTVRSCFSIPDSDGNLNRATNNNVTSSMLLCQTDLCNGASSFTATTALLASMALVGILGFRS